MKCETCAHFKACKRLIDERYEELVPCEEYQSVYTVDAAPVVRCGECKFYKPAKYAKNAGTCHKRSGVCKSDDFCSYGELKEQEANQ